MSEANDTGFYGQARLDKELILSLPPDDVWVTSACIKFWDYEDVEDFVKALHEHFGRNFFLEVQYHNTESQRELNERMNARTISKASISLKLTLKLKCKTNSIYLAI